MVRPTRRRRHQIQSQLKLYLALVLGTIFLAIFLFKFPLVSAPKKQYIISGDTVEKVPAATTAGVTVKPLVESIIKASPADEDVVFGNEFAKLGVLDYYPGGYHVSYPDGFTVSYTPTLFVAVSPAGGKVSVTITGQNFKVDTDLFGAPESQKPVIEAAGRLVSRTFRFLLGSGYDMDAAKARFAP